MGDSNICDYRIDLDDIVIVSWHFLKVILRGMMLPFRDYAEQSSD